MAQKSSKRAARQTAKPAAVTRARRRTRKAPPVLDRRDVRRIITELAARIAPADVTTLMSQEATIRAKAREIRDPHLLPFRAQLELALDCLRDHVDERCPQIPYYTISLLGAAALYFSDELDAIPDFLPHIGNLDDAVVMGIACQLGADGLRRYCDWKGRDAYGILVPVRH